MLLPISLPFLLKKYIRRNVQAVQNVRSEHAIEQATSEEWDPFAQANEYKEAARAGSFSPQGSHTSAVTRGEGAGKVLVVTVNSASPATNYCLIRLILYRMAYRDPYQELGTRCRWIYA